jgi:SAM-dependent methyltransferase
MPANLSLKGKASTAGFYSPIHGAIAAADQLPPTVQEFLGWLIVSRIRGDALDAGCGAHGLITKHSRGLGLTVTAIDSNPDVIHSKPDIGASLASVLDLPFPEGSFDLTICTGVAHHTPDPEKAISELARVTKPGGVVYLSLYCFHRSPAAYAVRALRAVGRIIPFRFLHTAFKGIPAINNFVLDHMYVPILWLFTAAEVRSICFAAGLIVVDEFKSTMDPLPAAISGDGLLRVFICRRGP